MARTESRETSDHFGRTCRWTTLVVAACVAGIGAPAHADIIDFEDSPTPFSDDYDFRWGAVAEGYRGFSWSTNWNGSFELPIFSAAVYQNTPTLSLDSGFQTAIPQGTKALFTPADFDQGYCFLQMSRGELWNIESLRVAAAWRNGVTVELLGLRGGQTVFNSFATLGVNGVMSQLSVNAAGIDTLLVIGYGGVPAYPVSDNSLLIIDNISYSIPAPGAVAVFAIFLGVARRRR